MGWFFVYPPQGGKATLFAEEVHHLRRVTRARRGDEILILDGQGGRGEGRWLGGEEILITQWERIPTPSLSLIVALGDPRGLERALPYIGEIGVKEIFLIHTRRSLSATRAPLRWTRWQHLLMAGCRISGNAWLPLIHDPIPWERISREIPETQLIILDPRGQELSPAILSHSHLYLVIGPEGGWEAEEIKGHPTYRLLRPVLSQTLAMVTALALISYMRELSNPCVA